MSRTDKTDPYWVKANGTDQWHQTWFNSGPPRDYIHAVATGPERAHIRDTCRDAARDHNANGHTDVIIDINQHRHSAKWTWY